MHLLLLFSTSTHRVIKCLFTEEFSPEDQYKIWIRRRYNECSSHLLTLMMHSSAPVQELALCTLMRFVQAEGSYPLESPGDVSPAFPMVLLKAVVDQMLVEDVHTTALLTRFQEFLEFTDVVYYTMSVIRASLAGKQGLAPSYLEKLLVLLSALHPLAAGGQTKFFISWEDSIKKNKCCDVKEHSKGFENLWLHFLKNRLPRNLYKRVLVLLPDHVIPFMRKPPLLIDFLTVAYNVGGAVSLLALKGLFILMHQHNLEYPDFYRKLYNLFEPSVLNTKYRANFFKLANVFLSSTHLPAYLVGAFVKRLSRLSLVAPPHSLLLIMPFIYNLLRRHPACRVLLHRPDGPTDLEKDPYLMDEDDPMKSHALESSLWEIQTMQNHFHPTVAQEALAAGHPLPEKEQELTDLLEMGPQQLFEREFKKTLRHVPLEFLSPSGLLNKKDDMLALYWTL
uniref:Nucleolar complex associated 4 homolog n=1 Tax=Eptatretus burgeri TaxID=7764 RepID=A0A8C4N733_EPTBU